MDWVPLWNRTLYSRKAQSLDGEVFKTWINLLCLASSLRRDGRLPDIGQIAFELRLDDRTAQLHMESLVRSRMIDSDDEGYVIHDWQSWQLTSYNSTPRVRKHREKRRAKERSVENNGTPGTGETFHRVPGNRCNALEEKRGEEKRECAAPAPAPARTREEAPPPTEDITGRSGEEHALFCETIRLLESVEDTRYFAAQLIMAADTPEIRAYLSWRLFVAAHVIQRPNRSKSWDTFCRAAYNATPEEYQKLRKGPATIPIGAGRGRTDGPTNMPPSPPGEWHGATMTRQEYRELLKAKEQKHG